MSAPPSTAMSVTGPVPAADLGVTPPHEHVIFTSHYVGAPTPEMRALRTHGLEPVSAGLLAALAANPFATGDNLRQTDVALASAEIGAFVAAGGRTLVDVSCKGLGRDPVALAAVARATGATLIAATGWYVENTHPPDLAARDEAALADELIRDLTEGIAGTAIRPGIIGELGVGGPMYGRTGTTRADADIADAERTVLRAAAIAHRATGAPISIHLWNFGPNGLAAAVLDILEGAGVDPGRVALGHLDAFLDLPVVLAMARRGAYVELDAFGVEPYDGWTTSHFETDAERIACVRTLVEAGLADRVLVSQDVCTKTQLRAFGGPGYGHIERVIVPALLAEGVPEAAIRALRIDNPARFLGWST